MIIRKADEVPAMPVEMEGASGVQIQLLVHKAEGAPNFFMRQFTVAPGGHTPQHAHGWEHECYILEGEGVMATDDGDKPIGPGDCLFIAGQDVHQFRNTGQTPLKFLCLVPRESQ